MCTRFHLALWRRHCVSTYSNRTRFILFYAKISENASHDALQVPAHVAELTFEAASILRINPLALMFPKPDCDVTDDTAVYALQLSFGNADAEPLHAADVEVPASLTPVMTALCAATAAPTEALPAFVALADVCPDVSVAPLDAALCDVLRVLHFHGLFTHK